MPLTKDEIRSLLSDIENERVERTLATFKVVVQNADIIENGTDGKEKKPTIIVNVTESGTNNDTNGTMRNDSGTMRNDAERYEDIDRLVMEKMRRDKRISVTQLSKMFGKSKTTMFRVIDRLKSEGKIRRVGSEKSGTWEVIE